MNPSPPWSTPLLPGIFHHSILYDLYTSVICTKYIIYPLTPHCHSTFSVLTCPPLSPTPSISLPLFFLPVYYPTNCFFFQLYCPFANHTLHYYIISVFCVCIYIMFVLFSMCLRDGTFAIAHTRGGGLREAASLLLHWCGLLKAPGLTRYSTLNPSLLI